LPAVSLQPAAGSQGELTGLMLMRAYFADRGEARRTIVVADTAHGTNPASVTMAGYELRKVETDERGNIDVAHLRELVDGETAGRGPARSRCASGSSRSSPSPPSSATATPSGSTTTGRSRSGRYAASAGRSVSSSARTHTSVPTGPACGRCRRSRC